MRADIYRQMQQSESRHWWFCARREIIHRLIALHLPNADGRVLDAGCGTGGNLQMLGRFGVVTGVEMDPGAARMARDKASGVVLEGYLPDQFPLAEDDQFGLIAALDVLEHIDDDVASLERLKRYLAPGGKMVVTVPAFPALWGAHDEAHHHKRRYTRTELQQKVESVGMKVGYISYYNSLLFPVAAIERLLHRLVKDNGSDTQAGLSVPAGWLNRLLYGVFVLEKHVIGRVALPFGLSLVAVLESVQ